MKISRFLLVLAIFLTFHLFAWDEGSSSYDSMKVRAKNSNAPFIVYVRADWCKWCKKLDELLERSDFQKAFGRKLTVKITPDNSPEAKKIAKSLGVRGYPTVFIIFPNGSKSKLNIPLGAPPKKALEALKQQLKRAYKE